MAEAKRGDRDSAFGKKIGMVTFNTKANVVFLLLYSDEITFRD